MLRKPNKVGTLADRLEGGPEGFVFPVLMTGVGILRGLRLSLALLRFGVLRMSIMSGCCAATLLNVLVELSPSTSSINASSDIWLTSSKVNSKFWEFENEF